MPRFNPPLPAPTGPVFRLVVEMLAPLGQRYQNVLDYMADANIGSSVAVATTFLNTWIANCQTALLATLAADVSVDQYSVAEIKDGTTPTYVPATTTVPGSVAGVSLPGTVAAVGTKYSSVKGQHGRGRMYHGPVPVSFITPAADPNVINAGGITAYDVLHIALGNAIVAGGTTWHLAITSRPEPPLTLVSKATLVTRWTTQKIIGTVKRRREGRGI